MVTVNEMIAYFFSFFIGSGIFGFVFDASQHQNLTHCNFANVTLHRYERVCPSICRSGLSNQDLASATKIRLQQSKSGHINTNLASLTQIWPHQYQSGLISTNLALSVK